MGFHFAGFALTPPPIRRTEAVPRRFPGCGSTGATPGDRRVRCCASRRHSTRRCRPARDVDRRANEWYGWEKTCAEPAVQILLAIPVVWTNGELQTTRAWTTASSPRGSLHACGVEGWWPGTELNADTRIFSPFYYSHQARPIASNPRQSCRRGLSTPSSPALDFVGPRCLGHD